MKAAFRPLIHRQEKASPSPAVCGHYTGDERFHGPFMAIGSRRYPQTYTQPVTVADALIRALRSPQHAAPVLRPIADELEARRDRP